MSRIETPNPNILFVSTYPPTICGLASFTAALIKAMAGPLRRRRGLGVARVMQPEEDAASLDEEVAIEVRVESPYWPSEIAAVAGDFDVLWIQHEFGIYGEEDGRGVLELCRSSPVPVLATLHTVPARLTTTQLEILEEIGSLSDTVVVMSGAARARLLHTTGVDPEKVIVIPHGTYGLTRGPASGGGQRPTIITWGLMGPDKGIEWGIEAMAYLRHLEPRPRYLVVGLTHPMVKRREGEAYRTRLLDRVSLLGLEGLVEIRDEYLSLAELARLLEEADMALIPYDSTEQVTSGVLVEAVAAGLPVVATAFPHAVELLSGGAGTTVPHRDPAAIARTIEQYLTQPDRLRSASAAAVEASRELIWDSVADRHKTVAERASAPRARAS